MAVKPIQAVEYGDHRRQSGGPAFEVAVPAIYPFGDGRISTGLLLANPGQRKAIAGHSDVVPVFVAT